MSSVVPFPVPAFPRRHSRSGFESIPQDVSRQELVRYFTYSDTDKREIFQCRGAHNQIGFALLLGGVRMTGRFPYDFEPIPRSLLTHVCKQLGVEVPLFLSYPQRQPTRFEHVERLKAYLGLRNFTGPDQALVFKQVREEVRSGARLHELLPSLEQGLREQNIVLPGVTVLEKLIARARREAEEQVYQDLYGRVDAATRARIFELLHVPAGGARTPFQQLQQAAGRPSPKALGQELACLETVRSLLPATLDLSDVHPHLLEHFTASVSALPVHAVHRFAEPKRLSLLLCWLWQLRTKLTDTAWTMGNELVAGVLRRAKNAFNDLYRRQQKRVGRVLNLCGDVIALLLDQTIPDAEVRATIWSRWSNQDLEKLKSECTELAFPPEFVYLGELKKRYSYVRQFAPSLLEAFALRSVTSEPLLKAVEILRECNRNDLRKLPDEVPLEFVPAAWRPHVCPQGGPVDRALWEICVLSELRLALKGGNVQVPHSHAFQPIESYLLRTEDWDQQRVTLCQMESLPLDFPVQKPKLEKLLQENLRLVDQTYPDNRYLEIRDDQFHLARQEKAPVPESAQQLQVLVRKMIHRRHLTDVLLETHAWTGFLKTFTSFSTGRPVIEADLKEQITLLAGLIAEGCNIGLTEMAVACPGLGHRPLEDAYNKYIREETLAAATALLVNFHGRQPLTEAWGQGRTSSSDAQLYGVPVRALNATFHPRYFAQAGRGVGIYTHVSDLWIPFYTQVITCHVRQAAYILDGLLYHATHLEPAEHYTDTGGYTELIFAVCHLLGIRFAPRIKDLPEQRLYRLEDHCEYHHIQSVFSGKINFRLIEEYWDEMLRLVASIKTGKVRASLIINKLSAASPRNKLFRALQELGRLVKTAYLAEYVRDPELRHRVQLGLNKGETLHSLARKLFFGQQGEIRDRTYPEQLNTASCLNLLLAAIVVWNTLHLQGCLRRLQADGHPVADEDLRFLSPLMHRHIGIYGQYSFDVKRLESVPSPENFSY